MSKTALAQPSAEAKSELACNQDQDSGRSRRHGDSGGDCLRLDPKGHAMDARYRLVSRDSAGRDYARRLPTDDGLGWGQWREPGGYAGGGYAPSGYGASGSTGGRTAGWSRDGAGGGRRDAQTGWPQPQRGGFWSW
jgi:hypothetical protein